MSRKPTVPTIAAPAVAPKPLTGGDLSVATKFEVNTTKFELKTNRTLIVEAPRDLEAEVSEIVTGKTAFSLSTITETAGPRFATEDAALQAQAELADIVAAPMPTEPTGIQPPSDA